MLQAGIVGLPNVGKSTLFNALTAQEAALAANYPFATIEPNVGVVPVPDGRLPVLEAMNKAQRVVPATVEFVDIAGLVRGASKGEGLGNQFLANIREADAVCQVIRAFNEDMPYDRFVKLQLAADLMPDATRDACLPLKWMQPHFMDEAGNLVMSVHALDKKPIL